MNSTDNKSLCKNCGSDTVMHYCANCGQKVSSPLTTKSLLQDAVNRVFNLEKGFLFTFWQLLHKPSFIVKDYLGGKRASYQNPFSYLVLSLAAVSISLFFVSSQEHVQILLDEAAAKNPENPFLTENFNEYLNLFLFSIIPIISLITLLLFRKIKFNFAEHLVINTYVFAQINFFNALFSLIIFISPSNLAFALENIATFFAIVYLSFAYQGVYRGGIWGVLKTIFSFVVSMIIISIILILLMLLRGKIM